MNALQILSQNAEFVGGVYNIGPLFSFLILLLFFDTVLKGWGMWRAARMSMRAWFIALLVMNSGGILPIIFLLMTKKQYHALQNTPVTSPSSVIE